MTPNSSIQRTQAIFGWLAAAAHVKSYAEFMTGFLKEGYCPNFKSNRCVNDRASG
jgi:hypothetical protein